jgi:hypothetical protein
MASRETVNAGRFPDPAPEQHAWPPPEPPTPPEPLLPVRAVPRWWCLTALLAGVVGVVGALLPAMDGQKVGDIDSVAFRVGVPLGFLGGVVALALGVLCTARSTNSAVIRGIAITSIVAGAIALLLTAALAFSG